MWQREAHHEKANADDWAPFWCDFCQFFFSITDNYDEIPSQVTNPVTKEVLDKCFALDVGQLQIDVGLLEGK